jgi:hypothetical protein
MMHNCAGPDSAVNGKIAGKSQKTFIFQYLDQSNKWALCCHKNFILRRR